MTGRTSEQAVGSHWVVGNVMAAFSLFGDAARIVSACKRLFLNGQCIEKMFFSIRMFNVQFSLRDRMLLVFLSVCGSFSLADLSAARSA